MTVTAPVRWWATMLSQDSNWPGPAPVTVRPRSALRGTTMLVAASMPCPATSPTHSSTTPDDSTTASYQPPPTRCYAERRPPHQLRPGDMRFVDRLPAWRYASAPPVVSHRGVFTPLGARRPRQAGGQVRVLR